MKLLIDTNVILDMVLKRNGCGSSMELFRKVRETGAGAYITGKNNRMDYIITVNQRDYSDISLPVMTPEEWVHMVEGRERAHKKP